VSGRVGVVHEIEFDQDRVCIAGFMGDRIRFIEEAIVILIVRNWVEAIATRITSSAKRKECLLQELVNSIEQ